MTLKTVIKWSMNISKPMIPQQQSSSTIDSNSTSASTTSKPFSRKEAEEELSLKRRWPITKAEWINLLCLRMKAELQRKSRDSSYSYNRKTMKWHYWSVSLRKNLVRIIAWSFLVDHPKRKKIC
jgi:hypothetical protein